MQRELRVACLIGLWTVLGLCVSADPAGAQSGRSYRIGPRDLVEVKVFEEPALNGSYRVDANGAIRLPLIGEFPVAGMTESELSDSLRGHLEANYLQNASVTIEVSEFLSQPISVIGAVNEPGNLGLVGRYTLLQAITAAGGLAENHGNRVLIRRQAANGLSAQIEIDLEKLLLANDSRLDIPIFSNDVINIPTTTPVVIYLLGEVGTQGALEFDSSQRVTVLTAISRAGGITERAGDKITVRRQMDDGSTREIVVDYKRIVSGRDPDLPLEDGDVLVIKESFF